MAGDAVYLTFDDGPIPEATPWVLDTLAKYEAKATFFCVGDNVRKHKSIFDRISNEGHSIGNHSQHHLNGWYTDSMKYIADVTEAAEYIDSNLYRPPYGKLKPSQYKALKKEYRIIMWDVLSMDYDPTVTAEQCKDIVLKNTKEGSIVVFHDSLKSIDKLKAVLPGILRTFQERGLQMKAITNHSFNNKTV